MEDRLITTKEVGDYRIKIYYLSFNWNGYGEKITQEEFDDFVNKVDRSQLPEGIKFELK